jgi:hypothetical protein
MKRLQLGLFVCILTLMSAWGGSSRWPEKSELTILWYNAENLFHPSNDTLQSGDDEFTPEGLRGWTYSRYRKKLTNLARVILLAGEWDAPALVGLCEVEDGQVLEDLVEHPLLKAHGYSYLHRDSPDHRGMDVACLFRYSHFRPAGWSFYSSSQSGELARTREILHLWGEWNPRGRRGSRAGKNAGRDSLDLFLIHWMSKYRGEGLTSRFRREQNENLMQLADSVHLNHKRSLLLVMGDFNDDWETWSMEPLRDSLNGRAYFRSLATARNSYKYRARWSTIDHALLYQTATEAGERDPYIFRAEIVLSEGLLETDLKYGGFKPFRTYEAYSYEGGYSDHLPVRLRISPAL